MPPRRLSQMSTANKGLLAIIGGTGLGQLLLLASSPVLSRVYDPDVFGPFAVINAIVLPLSTVAALRYELALPIPRRESDARLLVKIAMVCVLAVTLIATIAVSLASRPIGQLVGLRGHDVELLWWVPIVGALMGTFVVLNQLAIREQMYSAIARRNLLQALATMVFQIGAGLAGLGAHGLAAGLAAGQATGVVALGISLRAHLVVQHDPGRVRHLAREFRSFPLFMAPSALINNLGIQMPVLMAAALFGQADAGLLGMTQRILVLPVSLIGMAMAQVFLGEFGAAHRRGGQDLTRLFYTATRRLAIAGGAIALALLVLAPIMFPFVLGNTWRMSGTYAQALALGMAAQMIAAPLSQAIVVTRRVGVQVSWDIGRLVAVSAAMLVGKYLLHTLSATLCLLMCALVLTYAIQWLLARRCVLRAVPRTGGLE